MSAIACSVEPGTRRRKVQVVVNGHSGTGVDHEVINEGVRTILGSRGWDVDVAIVPCTKIGEALRDAASAEPDVLLVGGGDGTIRTVLEFLIGSKVALGVLPMGTMNFIARDLGIPLKLEDAIAALATADVRCIDVGEVNGRHFLHSSTLGIVPRLAVERERLRRAHGWRARLSRVKKAIKAAAEAPTITVELEHGGRKQALETFAVIVSNNPLSDDPRTPYRRHVLDSGKLSVYVSRHKGRAGLARLLLTMGSGWWFWDGKIEKLETPTVRIRGTRALLPVTNDGEIDLLASPLTYRVRPCALRVLAPKHETPGT